METKVITTRKTTLDHKEALLAQVENFLNNDEDNIEVLANFIANANEKKAKEIAAYEAAYERYHNDIVNKGLEKLDSVIDDSHACEWV